MAGKVQWHPGSKEMFEAYGKGWDQQFSRVRDRCKLEVPETWGWCLPHDDHLHTGVFLLTNQELAFFRWQDDAYVVTARLPCVDIESVLLEKIGGIGAPYVVIYTDGQPMLLYVLVNKVFTSYSGTGALHEKLTNRNEWCVPEPAL